MVQKESFRQMDPQCLSPEMARRPPRNSILTQNQHSKSSGHLGKVTIPRISISDSFHLSRNTRSMENLHVDASRLEIPASSQSSDKIQRNASLSGPKLPIQNSRRLSVCFNLSKEIETHKSYNRRPSVFSQLSDFITTSRSNSRTSNCSPSLARRKRFHSSLNLFFIRSILIVTLVVFAIFIYKFYTYLRMKIH